MTHDRAPDTARHVPPHALGGLLRGAAGLRMVFAEVATGVLERLHAAGVNVSGLAFPTVDEACANIARAEPGTAARPLTGAA